MRQFGLIFILCCLLCLQVTIVSSAGDQSAAEQPTTNPAGENAGKDTNTTTSPVAEENPLGNPLKDYKSMTSRILYVVIAVSAIVGVYFVIRTIRIRRGRRKAKKYGVVASAQGDMELQPLEEDDDEEDMTVFDRSMTNHK